MVKEGENQRPKRELTLKGQLSASPIGIEVIGNLNFKPGQWVMAVVELEGFTLQSEWVKTDGILMSTLMHNNLRIKNDVVKRTTTWAAEDSYVMVSAIRSNHLSPMGEVGMAAGLNFPHRKSSVEERGRDTSHFENAQYWFQTVTTLQTMSNQTGASVAHSGPWSFTVASSGIPVSTAFAGDAHRFEQISYIHEGKELGYSFEESKCPKCSSPFSAIETWGKTKASFFLTEGELNKSFTSPMPSRPVTKPILKP